MRKRNIFFLSFVALMGLTILLIIYCNNQVSVAANGKTFFHVNKIPHQHVSLLLGTGKYLNASEVTLYYSYRIEAALKLLKAKKIDYLVISGDNSRINYMNLK